MVLGGQALMRLLARLRQWSELSSGPASVEELMEACELDEHGKVDCPVRVTELIAETYILSAEIYLHCRLFRYITRTVQ